MIWYVSCCELGTGRFLGAIHFETDDVEVAKRAARERVGECTLLAVRVHPDDEPLARPFLGRLMSLDELSEIDGEEPGVVPVEGDEDLVLDSEGRAIE